MDMISPPHQRNLSRSTRYPVRPPVCRHPPPRLALTAYETDIFFLTISALSTRALRSSESGGHRARCRLWTTSSSSSDSWDEQSSAKYVQCRLAMYLTHASIDDTAARHYRSMRVARLSATSRVGRSELDCTL
jgi:hypothetical protein